MSLAEQQALEDIYLMHTFARKPVEFVRGEGMHLYDDTDKPYLDLLSGIGVVSLGHGHPALTSALTDQVNRLMHVGNYFYIEERAQVARVLSELVGDQSVFASFFANSGAEANECALKLARLYARKKTQDTTKRIIVNLDGSFHGRTLETLAATAQPAKQELFEPLPDGFVHVRPNDEEALRELFETQGEVICAMIVEVIQGESGVHPLTSTYLQLARELTQAHDALLICDEVQSGIYRTGDVFAYQDAQVIPDIITIAKGIGGGFPMGVCMARAEVAAAFEPGEHGTTFGGSPLAITAASVVLSQLGKKGVSAQIKETGAYLMERLAALPQVAEVRGRGLMVGCDLVSDVAHQVVSEALREGLVINATGAHTLRFLPPLICSPEDIDASLDILEPILERCVETV